MSEKRYWGRDDRDFCRVRDSSSIRPSTCANFGNGLGRVAVLPAGVSAGRVKPSNLRRLEDLQRFPFIDKTIERDRQVGDVFGRSDRRGRRGGGFRAASSGNT